MKLTECRMRLLWRNHVYSHDVKICFILINQYFRFVNKYLHYGKASVIQYQTTVLLCNSVKVDLHVYRLNWWIRSGLGWREIFQCLGCDPNRSKHLHPHVTLIPYTATYMKFCQIQVSDDNNFANCSSWAACHFVKSKSSWVCYCNGRKSHRIVHFWSSGKHYCWKARSVSMVAKCDPKILTK